MVVLCCVIQMKRDRDVIAATRGRQGEPQNFWGWGAYATQIQMLELWEIIDVLYMQDINMYRKKKGEEGRPRNSEENLREAQHVSKRTD